MARQRSQTPWREASHAVPAELAKMEYDDYRDIRFNADSTLWRADKLPYEANFFHVGRHGDSVRIHEITTAGVKRLPYDPATFNFGKNKLSPETWGDLGHGGVRFFSNLNSPTYKDELVVFTGATYFRALGAGQRYGLSARGLAVDTAGGGRWQRRVSALHGLLAAKTRRRRQAADGVCTDGFGAHDGRLPL
jgi:glucans biosynthesis protein